MACCVFGSFGAGMPVQGLVTRDGTRVCGAGDCFAGVVAASLLAGASLAPADIGVWDQRKRYARLGTPEHENERLDADF